MFKSNPFDKAIKSAEKLERILRQSERLRALGGIERGLEALTHATEQAERLIQRTRQLIRENVDLAHRQADVTKEMYKRVRFYDRELSNVQRTRAELERAKVSETRRFDDQKRRQLAANAVAKSGLETEINRRNDLMSDLTAEYNLRVAIEGTFANLTDLSDQLSENNGRTLDLQNKLRDIENERLRIENARSQKLDDINGKLTEQTVLEDALKEMRDIDRQQQRDLQKQNFKDFMSAKVFDGILGKFKNLSGSLKGLGAALGGLALVALVIKSIVGTYRAGIELAMELGLDASQRVAEVSKGQDIVVQAFKNKALISIEDAIRAKGALGDLFGTLDIPDTLILKSAELTRQIGLTSEEAGNILDFFTRIRGESAVAASNSAVVFKATALRNNVNPATIMRDVAANAENFAKSGRASADDLARAAISVRRLGIDLGTVSSIADRLVTDFEGSLESAATIGAFAPGFDQSGLMIASQFGTDADIAREIKNAVNSLGVNVDDLPRSFKLGIANSLGLSVEQLTKVAKSNSDKLDILSPDAEAMVKATSNASNELQQALINPLDSIEKGIFGIFAFLVSRFSNRTDRLQKEASSLSNAELQKITERGFFSSLLDNLLSTITRSKSRTQVALEELQKRQAAPTESKPESLQTKVESRASGGVVGFDAAPTKLVSSFDKLQSNEVPTILHKGEAVLNTSQMNMLNYLTGAQSVVARAFTDFSTQFAEKLSSTDKSSLNNVVDIIDVQPNNKKSSPTKVNTILSSIVPYIINMSASLDALSTITAKNQTLNKVTTLDNISDKQKNIPKINTQDFSELSSMIWLARGANIQPQEFKPDFSIKTQEIKQVDDRNRDVIVADNKGVEQKLDTLINLLRSGAIQINLDGKKVSDSLVDANRYG